ncbi:MAG: hypothetical protein H6983_07715 [Ectothiorhodospiraceae bacterium]|nr:hypothetical protein [Chromatiales bacterium]MCP5154033.1 hypothetical protein [Ectothiorhodospiraceae bacterium]
MARSGGALLFVLLTLWTLGTASQSALAQVPRSGAEPARPPSHFPALPPGAVMAPSQAFAELLDLFATLYLRPNGSELHRALMLAPAPSMVGIGHALARQTRFAHQTPSGGAVVNQLYHELRVFAQWLAEEYDRQGRGSVSAEWLFGLADRAARGGEVDTVRSTFNIEPDAVPAIAALGGAPDYATAYGKAFDALRRQEDEVTLLGQRVFPSNEVETTCEATYNRGVDAFNEALRAWSAGRPGAAESLVNQAEALLRHACKDIPGCASLACGIYPKFHKDAGVWANRPPRMDPSTEPLPRWGQN